MALIVNNQVLFSKRVSPTKITHNEGDDDRANHSATRPDSQKPEDPAAHDAAEDAENMSTSTP
jgi:hypothetical protein